jgi:hypothetical protein
MRARVPRPHHAFVIGDRAWVGNLLPEWTIAWLPDRAFVVLGTKESRHVPPRSMLSDRPHRRLRRLVVAAPSGWGAAEESFDQLVERVQGELGIGPADRANARSALEDVG